MSMIYTIDRKFTKNLQDKLIETFGIDFKIYELVPVYGGDINQSYKIKTSHGDFFIKLNDAQLFPGMFEKEAHGLQAIQKTGSIRVPRVVKCGETGDTAFLLMEYIEEGKKAGNFWENFGRQLADMHRHTEKFYGFYEDNYIGSLLQFNTPDPSWVNFYIEQRLKPQIKMAANNQKLDIDMLDAFERLFDKLHDLLPDEFPHLLHGDLWNGNFLTAKDGTPVLIDPAVYYGNREVDLAMTKLFGGFDEKFYQAYNEAYPLLSGWEERIPIYQLYPLLVHVNLFGGGYADSIRRILKPLVG